MSSPVLPLRADTEDRSTDSKHLLCQGAKWAAILTQILPKLPSLSRATSTERQTSPHRCRLEKMTASLQQGLAPLVRLWGSQKWIPPGRGCSYTLNNTGTVVLSTAPFRSAEMNTKMGHTAICAADTTAMFVFFFKLKWADHLVPAALSSHLSLKLSHLLTPCRRAFAHWRGVNTEV